MSLCSRRLLVLATASLAVAAPVQAMDICDELQSRLASLPNVDTPVADAGTHSNAITQQIARLQEVRADLHQLGCSTGSVTVFRTSNARGCSELSSSVERMERNLKRLEARQRDFATIGSYQEARVRILAESELNGCQDIGGLESAGADDGAAAIEFSPEDEFASDRLAPRYGATPGGRLRTVCVRTCDGGFFPITSGASPLDFRRDQRACARMCPQTETELYYQAIDSVDNAEMVSTVTGRLYAQLPTAFAYRTRDLSKPQACSCSFSADRRRNNSTTNGNAIKEDTGSITTIRMRPVGNAAASEKVVIERPYDPKKDKVRSVGPVFVPDEQPTIDLRNPSGPK